MDARKMFDESRDDSKAEIRLLVGAIVLLLLAVGWMVAKALSWI